MGAIASGGLLVLDPRLVQAACLSPAQLERTIAEETRELQRREEAYGAAREPPELAGKTVILAKRLPAARSNSGS